MKILAIADRPTKRPILDIITESPVGQITIFPWQEFFEEYFNEK